MKLMEFSRKILTSLGEGKCKQIVDDLDERDLQTFVNILYLTGHIICDISQVIFMELFHVKSVLFLHVHHFCREVICKIE